MYVLHGTYHFRQRRVAFRNDFCINCREQRRVYKVRSLEVMHLSGIPLLPLGTVDRWICGSCGKPPGALAGVRLQYKIAGMILLGCLALTFWQVAAPPGQETMFRLFRYGTAIGAVFALVAVLEHPRTPDLMLERVRLTPADDVVCPDCAVRLDPRPRWHCPQCLMERL